MRSVTLIIVAVTVTALTLAGMQLHYKLPPVEPNDENIVWKEPSGSTLDQMKYTATRRFLSLELPITDCQIRKGFFRTKAVFNVHGQTIVFASVPFTPKWVRVQ